MTSGTLLKRTLLMAAASLVAATGAYAQSPSTKTEGLEDIVVTARKRSESLISVPVAVTAITGAEVQRQGVSDLNRIAQLAPQVMLAKADSGAGATFTIRGLGSSPVDAGIEQSVTVVIDGVPITRGNVISAGLFDLEQVEVLKGPQALFFGKNSPAGVISLRTADPTDTFSGYARAGYEFEAQEKYGEAAIGGPITDTLKARFAFRGSAMRGWVQNVAEPIPPGVLPGQNPFFPTGSPGAADRWDPGTKEYMGRITLVWTPSDKFDANLKASGNHYHDNGTTTQAYCFDGTAPSANPLGNPPILDPFNNCTFDNKLASVGATPAFIHDWPSMHADGKPYSDQNTILTSLTMNYHLPNITITSVTSGMNLKYRQSNDYAFTSYGNLNVAIGENTHSYSEELRLVSDFEGPINFTAGAFYENVNRNTNVNSLLFFVGVDPTTGKYHTFENIGHNKAKTVSGFGQLRWEILKNIELAGGVRYTHESRDQLIDNPYVNPISGAILNLVPPGTPGSPFRGNFTDNNYSPEATISWKPRQDLMFYAAYKTGYKSGGFSTPSLYQLLPIPGTTLFRTPDESDYGFAPEKAKGYEIGFKGFMFDRRLRIETAAYRFNYTGLQLSVFNPQTFSFFIRNAGNARIQGFEVQGEFAATQALRLNASFTYNDAKFTDFQNGQCYTNEPTSLTPGKGVCTNQTQPLTGESLPRAPRYTFTAGGSYDRSINDRLMLGINGGVNYSAKYFTQDDHNPLTVQKAFTRADAGLRIYTPDDKYELAFIGRNLTNKYYIEYSTSKAFGKPTGDFQAATPRTRELRLQFTYKF